MSDLAATSATGGEDSTREINRLESEIVEKRRRVAASFRELRRRVDVMAGWRRWVASHPVLWISGGLTLGFIVGYRKRQK